MMLIKVMIVRQVTRSTMDQRSTFIKCDAY